MKMSDQRPDLTRDGKKEQDDGRGVETRKRVHDNKSFLFVFVCNFLLSVTLGLLIRYFILEGSWLIQQSKIGNPLGKLHVLWRNGDSFRVDCRKV